MSYQHFCIWVIIVFIRAWKREMMKKHTSWFYTVSTTWYFFMRKKCTYCFFLCLKSKTFSSKNKQKNEMFKVQFCRTQLQQPNNNRLNEYEKGRNGQKLNEIKNTNKWTKIKNNIYGSHKQSTTKVPRLLRLQQYFAKRCKIHKIR